MKSLPDRHNVREFVGALTAGTRVVWIANSTRGTVQPDKTILWDDGSHMTHAQMRSSHALLIHSEAEWLGLNESLSNLLKCLHCGCKLQRWDGSAHKTEHPEKLCPVAVLSDPETSPPHMRRRMVRPVRSDAHLAPKPRAGGHP